MKKEQILGYCYVAAFTVVLYLGLNNIHRLGTVTHTVIKLLTPFLIGIVLAFVLNFALRMFESRVFVKLAHHKKASVRKWVRPLSVLCSYVLLIFIVSLLLTVVIPQLVTSISTLSGNINGYITTLQIQAEKLITWLNLDPVILDNIYTMFWNNMENIPDMLLNMLKSVPQLASMLFTLGGGVLNAVVGFIVSIYLLLNKETLFSQMGRIVRAFLPAKAADRVHEGAEIASRTFTNYVSGQLLDALFVGIVSVIGLTLFRFPYAMLIGVVMGITNIIPFFGPFIGAVPGVLLLLIISPVKALLYIVFVLVVQQVDGNIIAPKIIGDSVGLPPLWVIFAVTIGGGLFGIAGMVLGTPVFAIFYNLMGRLVRSRLGESKRPPNSQAT